MASTSSVVMSASATSRSSVPAIESCSMSCAGLTRASSHPPARTAEWIAGSSPAMTREYNESGSEAATPLDLPALRPVDRLGDQPGCLLRLGPARDLGPLALLQAIGRAHV